MTNQTAGPCPYCGRTMYFGGRGARAATKEHVTPQHAGGTETVRACNECNNDKGGMSLARWAGRLERAGDRRAARVRAVVDAPPQAFGAPRGLEPDPVIRALAPVVAHKLWGKGDADDLTAAQRRRVYEFCRALAKALRQADLLK